MLKRLGVFTAAAAMICLLAGPASAQMTMSAGITAGGSYASLGGDVSGVSSDIGFAAGAFISFDWHKYFMLTVMGQYVQKGAKDSEFSDEKINTDYIEILVPFTATIPVGDDSPVEPRLFAGPTVGFLMNCKFVEPGEPDFDCKDITKSTDFGIMFGGGVDFMLGGGAIMLDIWYNLGLANINDDVDSDTFSVKNQVWQAMLGYRFFFGG
jgi:hypothetical protein